MLIFKNFKFNFSLKLYRLSQCRIFVVDDDNVTKLSQLTPYELNLQRKRNIMVRKIKNIRTLIWPTSYLDMIGQNQMSQTFLILAILVC